MNDSAYKVNIDGTILNTTDFVTTLKNKAIYSGATTFLAAKSTTGDNLGGFYKWDGSATDAEDLTYMNVVISNLSTTGRWVRIFQRAKSIGGGILVTTGGVKSFYVSGTTDSTGKVSVYPTDDGTATGNSLFTEIWTTYCVSTQNVTTANDVILCNPFSQSTDRKTVVFIASKAASTTLGNTLTSMIGLVIKAFNPAPAGVPCQVRVDGI